MQPRDDVFYVGVFEELLKWPLEDTCTGIVVNPFRLTHFLEHLVYCIIDVFFISDMHGNNPAKLREVSVSFQF